MDRKAHTANAAAAGQANEVRSRIVKTLTRFLSLTLLHETTGLNCRVLFTSHCVAESRFVKLTVPIWKCWRS
jgi:hypothetical protein